MKNFSSIAKKYLKIQKKRTILTCIGIILSVALITGSGTILLSIQDKFYRDAVENTGDYYAVYKNVSEEKAKIISNHAEAEKTAQIKDIGYAVLDAEKSSNAQTKYLSVKAYDSASFLMFPIKLLEGTLPQNPNEIVLEKRALKYFPDTAVGKQIKLTLGDRISPQNGKADDRNFYDDESFVEKETKQYTVTGFVNCRNSYKANLFYGFCLMDSTVMDNRNIFVKTNAQLGIQNAALNIAKDAGVQKEDVEFNQAVLRYIAQSGSDRTDTTVITFFIIIMVIITGATVAVIYNSFHISVLERTVQFGLFRCIGATPLQIKGVILKEAMIMAAIGIPIGIICGTAAIAGVFELFKFLSANLPFGDLRIIVSPWIIIPSVLLGLGTIYISVAGPAKKASKVSPMEALRNAGGYKKEKHLRKTSKTGRKFFGVYGFIAWRNLKRNKKRLRVTVFSMALSIILFIVISTFIHLVLVSGAVNANEYASFQIYTSGESDALLSESETNNLKQLEGIGNIYRIRQMNVTAEVPQSKLNIERAEIVKKQVEIKDGIATTQTNFLKTIGDDSIQTLQKYIKEGSLDANEMNAENGVLLVNTVSIFQPNERKSFVFDLAGLHPGDEISIGIPGIEGFSEKLKVTAVLTQNVLDENYNGFMGFVFITTDGVYNRISQNINRWFEANKDERTEDAMPAIFEPAKTMVQLKDKAVAEPIKKAIEKIAEDHGNWYVYDYDEMARNTQSTVLIISILFYGFITVIALIGALNIINTISTNILLRTRELSVFKAVGMTKKGLNILVYLESIYYSALSALFGGLFGTLLSWLLFDIGSMVKDIQWTVPWSDIFTALAGAAAVCLISGYLPLKRINNGVIIENISREQ